MMHEPSIRNVEQNQIPKHSCSVIFFAQNSPDNKVAVLEVQIGLSVRWTEWVMRSPPEDGGVFFS